MNKTLENRIRKCIALHHEGETWDFKREWYDKEKGRRSLLHDIICMANTTSDEDGILIIGVDEKSNYSIRDVKCDPNRKDTNDIVTFLREKPFDGGIRPAVRVESVGIDGKTIDVIVVENSDNVPFYLSEQSHGLSPYQIYTRVADTNTPINKSADRDKVEALWKKRFGIDKTALERFQVYLCDIDGWDSTDGQQTFFYQAFPEFRIEMESDDNRNGCEYYCCSQIDSKPRWYNIRLKCNGTVVADTSGVSLDGGRFFTVVPNTNFRVRSDSFYAYIEETLQYALDCFFLQKIIGMDYNSISRWCECIPVFKSKGEKEEFRQYLEAAEGKKLRQMDVCDRLQHDADNGMYQTLYLRAITITSLLDEFRKKKCIN